MNNDGFTKNGWHTNEPHVKCCKIPSQVSGDEAKIYQLLLKSHCEHPDKNTGHECCGKITITRKAITLQCPKCGDAKKIITEPAKDKQ